MALFSKNDLFYKDYSWSVFGGDNPKITGHPDSTLFNRGEGYEVLYLINKVAELNGWKDKTRCLKMEKLLHEKLPGNVRGQANVVNWLSENWNSY